MTQNYCQMRLIGDGLWCDEQPPRDDCCRQPAHDYIIVYGSKQWLCRQHYVEHMETQGLLHVEGEGLDAYGDPL